jgi:gluconate kinase
MLHNPRRPHPEESMEELCVQAGDSWKRLIAGHLLAPALELREELLFLEGLAKRINDPSLDFAIRQARHISQEGISAINVMGTMGSGKSVVGAALADALGGSWSYRDGDTFHPEGNIEKMRRGEALSEHDRLVFLQSAGAFFRSHVAVVSSCSALQDSYRAILHGCPAILPLDARWSFTNSSLGLVTLCLTKPFHTALEELDDSEKGIGARRTFSGQDHFIHVTKESPAILEKQYEIFERPKPWQAIILETDLYRLEDAPTPSAGRYDTSKMVDDLQGALGMRLPKGYA